MDREDLRDEIRRLVQDISTTDPRWTNAQLNTRIDQSHERVAALTKCIISLDNLVSIVAGTSEYPVPTGFLEDLGIMAKNSNGDWYALDKVTEQELNILDQNWRNATGSPEKYYTLGAYIYVYPTPDTSVTGGLSVDMYKRPTAFTTDADVPFDSDPQLYAFHDIICYDVASKCKFDVGEFEKGMAFDNEFQKRIREIRYQLASRTEETRMANIYEEEREDGLRTS